MRMEFQKGSELFYENATFGQMQVFDLLAQKKQEKKMVLVMLVTF